MKLVAGWEFGPYFYQVWETDTEFVCQGVHSSTLETLFTGVGNTWKEAVLDCLRKSIQGRS